MWHVADRVPFGLAAVNWEENAKTTTNIHLAYPLGRKWWLQHRESVTDTNLRAIIDQALEEDPDYRVRYFELLGDNTF